MRYPKAYIDYLVYFHGPRDYFECHEVLEEYWKEDKPGERKAHWVALIQVAVGFYHHRIKNYKGAERMIRNALHIFENEREAVEVLALDYEQLLVLLHRELEQIRQKKPYESVELPITDETLLVHCAEKCNEIDCKWGMVSDLENEELIRKHTLRDRSDVISERKKQLRLKQKSREASS
ncbi:DUF309 domain-containing protein [Bacillus tianshenii]|nr:DUF309 domain-containing protein [Bacillus tianshenii]